MQITFEVDLSNVDRYSAPLPYDTSIVTAIADSRRTWIPGRFIEGNRVLKHGDQFTVTDFDALYFKNNYTTGTYPVLKIITQS